VTLIVPAIFSSMIVAGRENSPSAASSLGDQETSPALGGARRDQA